jgi:hypothetical protein
LKGCQALKVSYLVFFLNKNELAGLNLTSQTFFHTLEKESKSETSLVPGGRERIRFCVIWVQFYITHPHTAGKMIERLD